MTKSMVLPIVMVIAMAIKIIFGIDIPQDTIDQITQSIVTLGAAVYAIYGIYKNHKAETKKK